MRSSGLALSFVLSFAKFGHSFPLVAATSAEAVALAANSQLKFELTGGAVIKMSGETEDVGEDAMARDWGGLSVGRPFDVLGNAIPPPLKEHPSDTSILKKKRNVLPNPKVIINPKWTVAVAPSTATTTTTYAKTTSTSPVTTTAVAKIYTGEATYFYQNGVAGACGAVFPDTALIVAMDTRMYGDENTVSKYCGKSVRITNTDNNKSVTAIIRDACPTCASSGSLDLSLSAFKAIGDTNTGVLPISWYFN